MLNKVIIMGRLVADPELRYTQNQTAVANFRIACDSDYKNQDGQRETSFFDIVAWRGVGENVKKYFTKGRMAIVEGRLQIRQWTDRDGIRRYTTEILANSVYFGDSKNKTENATANLEEPADDYAEFSDGDLPF